MSIQNHGRAGGRIYPDGFLCWTFPLYVGREGRRGAGGDNGCRPQRCRRDQTGRGQRGASAERSGSDQWGARFTRSDANFTNPLPASECGGILQEKKRQSIHSDLLSDANEGRAYWFEKLKQKVPMRTK